MSHINWPQISAYYCFIFMKWEYCYENVTIFAPDFIHLEPIFFCLYLGTLITSDDW